MLTLSQQTKLWKNWAGTKLKDLGQLLYEHGYSQENLGDINAQSIAGAVSTGTSFPLVYKLLPNR
ncbi:MAG: FAD-binding oxidoreductase [Brevibacillus sp.]|jgi:FAD/FMN-containing dehydrogenase|nr:FAD-binding oxidoreductase [Brevibacillus sp.]